MTYDDGRVYVGSWKITRGAWKRENMIAVGSVFTRGLGG
jgi:hypothetical protein